MIRILVSNTGSMEEIWLVQILIGLLGFIAFTIFSEDVSVLGMTSI